MTAHRPLLEIRDLTIKTSSGVALVEDVSFDLAQGASLGIVGESGSGKSLTALGIGGLLKEMIVTGKRMFLGQDLGQLGSRALRTVRGRDLAYIFQDAGASMLPVRSIGAQIVEQLRLHKRIGHKQAQSEMRALLQSVGLVDAARIAGRYVHELSGGMRQRAMIAMAISCAPHLLIADEPTSALDVTVQAQILALLRTLRAAGMAMIMVTHDFGVVAESCAELAVIYAGVIVEHGPTALLLNAPRHPYTIALLAARARMGHAYSAEPEALPVIQGAMPSPVERPTGCVFAPRCAFVGPECRIRPALRLQEGRRVRCVKI